jgi:hypothetical protein
MAMVKIDCPMCGEIIHQSIEDGNVECVGCGFEIAISFPSTGNYHAMIRHAAKMLIVGRPIMSIKAVRLFTNKGLKESKEIVDLAYAIKTHESRNMIMDIVNKWNEIEDAKLPF